MKSKRIFLTFSIVFVLSFASAVIIGAQELKFDGYINSGIGVYSTDVDGENTQFMAYGVDSERNIGRFRLNGAYTSESKIYGANFRFQVQGANKQNIVAVPFAYGWLKPHDIINIKFGLVDDGTWATADFLFNDDQGEGAGVLARITPIAGLDFGVGAYIADFDSGSNNNVFPSMATTLNWWDAKYTVNLAYTMDKIFRFMASFRNENTLAGNAYPGTAQALMEFRFLAVNNLTAVFVGQFNNLGENFIDAGTINIYETAGYKMGDLNFGLNAAQYFPIRQGGDFGLHINPWVSYALFKGKFVPRLDVNYFIAGEQNGTNYNRKALRIPSNGVINTDDFVFSTRPSLKFNLDSRNFIEIGDAIYYQEKNGSNKLSNVFYLDFVVRF